MTAPNGLRAGAARMDARARVRARGEASGTRRAGGGPASRRRADIERARRCPERARRCPEPRGAWPKCVERLGADERNGQTALMRPVEHQSIYHPGRTRAA